MPGFQQLVRYHQVCTRLPCKYILIVDTH
jgi:hypothetical protein